MGKNREEVVQELVDLISIRSDLVDENINEVAEVANSMGIKSPTGLRWTYSRIYTYWRRALVRAGYRGGKKISYIQATAFGRTLRPDLDTEIVEKMLWGYRELFPHAMRKQPGLGPAYFFDEIHKSSLVTFLNDPRNVEAAKASLLRFKMGAASKRRTPAASEMRFPLVDTTYEGEQLVFYTTGDIQEFLLAALAENDQLKREAEMWRGSAAALILQMKNNGVKPRVRVSNRFLGFSRPREAA